MTSLARKLRRAKFGAMPSDRKPPVRMEPNGSYSVLHPTNGWKRYSYKRTMIGPLMAHLLGSR